MTWDRKVPNILFVLGSELAYVRAQLKPLDAAARKLVAASVGLHPKTLNRVASRQTKYGRTDTIGKIALYFRTREKREAKVP